MMFRKILLPLDLTDKHERAVEVAAEQARHSGGEATLLHVIEEIAGLDRGDEKEFFTRLEQTAQASLDRIGRRLDAQGVPRRSVVLYGARVPEVARYAREMGADLIIVTGPRLDPAQPAASWGSLSWKIAVLGPCPVLLVK